MPEYTVTELGPLMHDGARYAPGARCALDEAAAAPLLRSGVLAETPSAPEALAPAPPPAPAAEVSDLVRAIRALDPDDPAHWTKSGKPDATALTERLGRQVSAAERDEAWAEVREFSVKAPAETAGAAKG